jgi:hypothetical protein
MSERSPPHLTCTDRRSSHDQQDFSLLAYWAMVVRDGTAPNRSAHNRRISSPWCRSAVARSGS